MIRSENSTLDDLVFSINPANVLDIKSVLDEEIHKLKDIEEKIMKDYSDTYKEITIYQLKPTYVLPKNVTLVLYSLNKAHNSKVESNPERKNLYAKRS